MTLNGKVAPDLSVGYVNIEAIRIYPSLFTKYNINSTRESQENPALKIKRAHRAKTGVDEVEIVFLGKYHIEKLQYFLTPPVSWTTWGELVLSPRVACELADKLKTVAG